MSYPEISRYWWTGLWMYWDIFQLREIRFIFTRTSNGEDQGFCWRDGQVFRLKADASTGNYQLAAGYGKLTWNGFSSAGFRMQVTGIENAFSNKPETFNLHGYI